ncbi:MAG TPA: PIN domain-containing protein [Pseudonocardiaceae bacterium]|nr:PIN domain-containing protein [Pseudonocardiaceae bacterium]
MISVADVDRLVLTPRYGALLSGVGTLGATSVQSVANTLVSVELDQRVAAFDEACEALDQQISYWTGGEKYLVADTSVYIQHPTKLEDWDVPGLISMPPQEAFRLLVPIAVIDELDGLKQSKDRAIRWRAGYTLAVIDRVFKFRSRGPAVLSPHGPSAAAPDFPGSGGVTVEILFDPPRHVRLPITDDEIIDRTVAAQPLAAREVTLVTYDTGMSTRARATGLKVVKLAKDNGEEPSDGK